MSTAAALLVLFQAVISVTHQTFLVPDTFRNVTSEVQISVIQTCADENVCRSDNHNATSCEAQGVCSIEDVCHGREDYPQVEHPLQDWMANLNNSMDIPGCTLIADKPEPPPPVVLSADDSSLTLHVNGTEMELTPCFTQRAEPLGSTFSLVFWMRADCRNCSVLEIPLTNGPSLHLRVVDTSLCINSDCVDNLLTRERWILLTVRAVDNYVSVYGGTNRLNYPNTRLDDLAVDNLYIGSLEVPPLGDMFELYDVRYYRDALVTSEIGFLETGFSDVTIDYGECRCPGAYPDFSVSDSTKCTNGTDTKPRFETTVLFNDPEVILDQDMSTRWVTSQLGTVVLVLNLGQSFEIESIKLTFTSSLPSNAQAVFISNGSNNYTHSFDCIGTDCTLKLESLDEAYTMATFEEHTAETVEISLMRPDTNSASFVISDLVISARCNCHGNAQSCEYEETGAYVCNCSLNSNTIGDMCETCQLNYYRSSNEFGCPNACSCNSAGVQNMSDMCDQTSGLCHCKSTVIGSACDECKSFTYNLQSSNPDGCSVCDCDEPGSLACNSTTGECQCKENIEPGKCDRCNNMSYNSSSGCLPCECDAAGSKDQRTDCSDSGQCYCKDNVEGKKCDVCKSGFSNLDASNSEGCDDCNCHPVGSIQGLCDTSTKQCSCRNGDTTDLNCTPQVTSFDPDFGPEIGGTLVTISGKLLGNDPSTVNVYLDDTLQSIISLDDNAIVFESSQYQQSGGSKTPQIKVNWSATSDVLSTSFNFQYKSNPYVDQSTMARVITYIRGGCRVEIHGSNLQSIKYPQMEVTNSAVSGRAVSVNCEHKSSHILCVTPDLANIRATSGSNSYKMTLKLDGFRFTEDLIVLSDPKVNDAGNIKFQYPFEDTEELSGSSLKSSCPVTVYLGVVSCEIKHVIDSSIEFKPPAAPPDGQRKHNISVHIGNFKAYPGTLEYLEFYETTGFIIIVSCVAGAILIAFVVFIICCCRSRRSQAAPVTSAKQTTGTKYKDNVVVEDRPMNNYSELITLVDAPAAPAISNGLNQHSGPNTPVRMETVIKEHKKGIVNTEAEDAILMEEFLPRVEPGLRDEVKRCYVGSGHFVSGRTCFIRGQHTRLVDGAQQRGGTAVQKLTIKSVINSISGHELPTWANLALSECLRLRKFKHTHILSIIGVGADKEQLHILYPYMSQGILKALVSDTSKEFSVRQLLGFSQQVAEGIDFLSSKDITHKDVAARNCMVDDFSVVKLSDASLSWEYYPDEYVFDQSRERYLPIRWMAPESLLDGYYDMRTDVWSFAVLVWELLTRGCLPFHEVTNSSEVSEYILQGYILGRPDTLSAEVYELLRSCWSSENESRPAIASVARTLGEILEGDDDGTYENANELSTFQHQRSSGMAASPRHHNGDAGNFYSTTNLSRV